MCIFRGNIKKLAVTKVITFYGLTPDNTEDIVNDLKKHKNYIYPLIKVSQHFVYSDKIDNTCKDNSVKNGRPYENPLFLDIISHLFFHGHKSFAALHARRFKCEWQNRVWYIIPESMLALVATAVSNVCLLLIIFDNILVGILDDIGLSSGP